MTPYYDDGLVQLYHGDCLEVDAWLAADVLLTDPPYGMAFVSGMRAAADRDPVAGDHDTAVRDAALARWGAKPALVFGTWRVARPAGTRQVVTWWKRAAGPGLGDLSIPWGCATEEIYVMGSGWRGARRPNVEETWDQRGNPYGLAAQTGHPTPKPTELIERLLAACPPGVVADPFAGAGSTLLACAAARRRCVGVEVEERHCATIARRLAQGTLAFGEAAS